MPQSIEFSVMMKLEPSGATSPLSIALTPRRWQISRATSGVTRSSGERSISSRVSCILSCG